MGIAVFAAFTVASSWWLYRAGCRRESGRAARWGLAVLGASMFVLGQRATWLAFYATFPDTAMDLLRRFPDFYTIIGYWTVTFTMILALGWIIGRPGKRT